MTLLSATNAKLEYDKPNGRIIYFDDDDVTVSSIRLDGSGRSVLTSGESLSRFAIDYNSRTLYYISPPSNNGIKSLNMTNSSDIVLVLDSGSIGSDVKDLDVDPTAR